MIAALRNRALAAFALGHFTNDLFMGVLTGLLPLFKEQLDLSNAQTGFLAFVLSASGSLLQPVFGLIADAIRSRWFVAAVIVWDAGFVSMLGFADSYRQILLICIGLGLGSAAFHPYGASGAVMVSEKSSLNTSMSFYTVGGTSGYAIGPVASAALVTAFGMRGTAGFAVLGVLAAFILGSQMHRFGAAAHAHVRRATSETDAGPPWRMLSAVIGIVILRSWTFMTAITLFPVHFRELGFSAGFYTPLAAVMILAGAVGTIAGGRLADRIGGRILIVAGQLLSILPFLVATRMENWLVFIFIGLFGLFSDSSLAVTLLAAQRLLPGRTGLASGVILGLGFVGGAVGVPITGAISDRIGIPNALALSAALPVAAAVGALMLPAAVFGLGARAEPGGDRPTGTRMAADASA